MPGKIYIVEQSKLIVHQLTEVMGNDFRIRSSPHADLALLEIIDWQPDLLITGVEVGNITGFDLCMVLKMIPDFAGMPVILLSSYKGQMATGRASEVGADYYIVKGIKSAFLIRQTIRELFPEEEDRRQICGKELVKLLLVDDSVLVRTMLANMFKSVGVAEIVQANNGREALEYLSGSDFDLVLSDYYMPEMDGPRLVREIRKSKGPAELPIIIATGETKEKQIKQTMADGANGVMIKPISTKNIKDILNAYSDGSIISFGYKADKTTG